VNQEASIPDDLMICGYCGNTLARRKADPDPECPASGRDCRFVKDMSHEALAREAVEEAAQEVAEAGVNVRPKPPNHAWAQHHGPVSEATERRRAVVSKARANARIAQNQARKIIDGIRKACIAFGLHDIRVPAGSSGTMVKLVSKSISSEHDMGHVLLYTAPPGKRWVAVYFLVEAEDE
jgi:hypothetical protein